MAKQLKDRITKRMLNKVAYFLIQSRWKNWVTAAFTMVITILWTCSSESISIILVDGDSAGLSDAIPVAASLIVSALYLVYLAIRTHYEERHEEQTRELSARYNHVRRLLTTLMDIQNEQVSLCRHNAKTATETIHDIESRGVVNLQRWEFEKICDLACKGLRGALTKHFEGRCDIEVGLVLLDESEKPERNIYLCAYAGSTESSPSIKGVRRSIVTIDKTAYYDQKLFKEPLGQIHILMTQEQIDEAFHWEKRKRLGGKTSKGKYQQCVFVPVFCDRGGSDAKLIALMEVVSLREKMYEDEAEIEDEMKQLIAPTAYLLLLMYKLHKGLLAHPSDEDSQQ